MTARMRSGTAGFVLATIGMLHAAPASAQAVYDCVPPATPSAPSALVLGNGSAGSVTTGQLQQALDAGGAIRLQIGSSTLAVTSTLSITRAVDLDLGGSTLSGGGTRRVVQVDNPGNLTYTVSIRHGTIRAGSTPSGDGAGLYKPTGGPWQAVTIRLFDLVFADNHAVGSAQDGGGGAVYVVGAAEIAAVRTSFDGNGGSNGGALYSLGSRRVNLFDSTFSGNHATGTGGNPGNGGNGGAIGVDGADRYVNLCRVRLLSNVANAFGGGLFTVAYDGTSFTRLRDTTVQANASTGSSTLAGGAYIQGSPIEVAGATFRDNTARGYAGLALFGDGGVLEGAIVNSTFVGNVASQGLGGAMSIQNATALTLQNVTIARNRADCDVCFAGGIANDDGAALTLRNVIFDGNTGGNAFNPWAMLNPAAHGANNLQWPHARPGSGGQQEAAVAPSTTFADPLLGTVLANGGPTETLVPGAGSPAIDAGTAQGAPPIDQRGFGRVGAVDIGAVEWQGDAIFANGFEAASAQR